MGALAIAGVLVVLSGLGRRRGTLDELVGLLATIALVFFVVRGSWRWWNRQPVGIASLGLVGALAMVPAGWLLVGIVHACSRVSSENFGMIIVWPIVFLLGIAVTVGGLVAAIVGVGVIVTAATKAPKHGGLVVAGGVAAVVLNLAHIYALVRLLYTG